MPDDPPEHQYQQGSESLSFPDDTVVGIVDDPDGAIAVIEALLEEEGIDEDRVTFMCGESGARRIDPEGERHGLLGRLQRLVQHYSDKEPENVQRQADELRAGRYLVTAPATQETRDRVAAVMAAHGARYINHYGTWTVTRLEA